ncbi:MAG: hypothetical protein M3R36_06920 [Bacteroidota bacterium]|nr:hypothetical protein [Bacteroidota bacterium]
MIKLFLNLLCIFFLPSFILSNNSDTIISSKKFTFQTKDTTSECKIITNSRSTYKDVQLFGLSDSTVKILKNGVTRELQINEIRILKFTGRGFGKGALIGGGIGFVMGFIIGGQNLGYSNNDFSFGKGIAGGFLIGVPFFFMGGGLGALFAENKLYDLGNMDLLSRKNKINLLIKEYSD